MSGLAFRGGTHELCSASFDRSVKVWSLDDRTPMDTLLGHQAEVLAIDMLRQVSIPSAQPQSEAWTNQARLPERRSLQERFLDCDSHRHVE